MHGRLDDGDPRAAGKGLDRELHEALALAGPRPGERESLVLLDRLNPPAPLILTVANRDLASLDRIQLDVRRHPLLEAVLIGERLPDLLGARLDERLALDPGCPLVGVGSG